MSDTAQTIPPEFLAMLVCPRDRSALREEPGALVCTACGHRYRVANGIPDMVIDHSQPPAADGGDAAARSQS
ncbi:MAG: Trm112 family protein [Planctomycetota bacterium]